LVNNAGITRDGLVLRMKDEDWSDVLAVNLNGAFYCARAALRAILKQKQSGRIINVGSVVGSTGNPARPITWRPRPGSSASPRRSPKRWPRAA